MSRVDNSSQKRTDSEEHRRTAHPQRDQKGEQVLPKKPNDDVPRVKGVVSVGVGENEHSEKEKGQPALEKIADLIKGNQPEENSSSNSGGKSRNNLKQFRKKLFLINRLQAGPNGDPSLKFGQQLHQKSRHQSGPQVLPLLGPFLHNLRLSLPENLLRLGII